MVSEVANDGPYRAGVKLKPLGNLIGRCGLVRAADTRSADGWVNQVAGIDARSSWERAMAVGSQLGKLLALRDVS